MSNTNDSVLGRMIKAVGTLSTFTLLSRVMGLVRDSVVAALFGSGPVAVAYATALKLPNMFRQMFAEGAMSASFVPVFTEKAELHGDQAAREFASAVASAMTLLIGGATILAIIFMRPLITLLNPPAESFELIITFTRIMSIYLLCMVLTALLTGVLNTKRHFATGAIAPIFLNLCIITGLVFAVVVLDLDAVMQGHALAISVAVAGVLQVTFVWLVAAARFRFVLYLPVPRFGTDVRRFFRLMVPGLIAAGGLQLNTLVGVVLSLQIPGGPAHLNYAERLYQLPIGLIAVAFGVAALPQLSAFFANDQRDRAMQTIRLGTELALIIAVPAALALVAMPEVIVQLLFERRAFTGEDTVVVAGLIAIFALALPALSIQRVFNASFHARKKMRPPMLATLAGVVLNIIFAIGLTPTMGLLAIPTAIVISAWIQVIALGYLVRRDQLWLPDSAAFWRIAAIVTAGLGMMAALFSAKPVLLTWAADSSLKLICITGLMILGGMLVYAASLLSLRGLHPDIRKLIPGLKK